MDSKSRHFKWKEAGLLLCKFLSFSSFIPLYTTVMPLFLLRGKSIYLWVFTQELHLPKLPLVQRLLPVKFKSTDHGVWRVYPRSWFSLRQTNTELFLYLSLGRYQKDNLATVLACTKFEKLLWYLSITFLGSGNMVFLWIIVFESEAYLVC